MSFCRIIIHFIILFILTGCAIYPEPVKDLLNVYNIEPFSAYNELFTPRDEWLGADGAYSIAIKDNVILWLFGDTLIGSIENGKRSINGMVNNSIAIQKGTDPSKASLGFFWDKSCVERPAAFIKPDNKEAWFWPFDGIMVNNKLYLFLMEIKKRNDLSLFDFKITSTWLAVIENPKDNPMTWRVSKQRIPWGIFSASYNLYFGPSIVKSNSYIYIYGCFEKVNKTGVFQRGLVLARVLEDDFPDFKKWHFFVNNKWISEPVGISELFLNMAAEFSVFYHPVLNKYIAVYTENGMSDKILIRTSQKPEGPWSESKIIYNCEEYQLYPNKILCYAAKAHPEITIKDNALILTYVCNTLDEKLIKDNLYILRPMFFKVLFKNFSP